MKKAAKWVATVLLWTLIAVTGALTGLRLAGPIDRSTAIGDIRLRIQASWHGQVDAYVPLADWGIRANAFSGPLTVRVEPRGVDRQALLRAAAGDQELLTRAEDDARDAATAAVIRAVVFSGLGVLAAGVLAALLRAALARNRPVPLKSVALWSGATLGIGALVIALAVLRMTSTFDTNAFAQPKFYARGAELSQLLQVSEKVEETSQGYSNSVQRTLAGYAALLSAGGNIQVDAADESPAVLVSDLHGNTLSLNALERLFARRPVFFAGDLGQAGTQAEANLFTHRLATVGKPVIAVSGNHDSRLIMRDLAGEGAVVLTDTGRLRKDGSTDAKPVQHIENMKVAGFSDPLEYRGPNPGDPKRIFSFSELPDGDTRYAAAQVGVVRWFDGLPERPDVVMIHQNGLAQHLSKTLLSRGPQRKLLILTGHDHRQHVDLYGNDITVVDAGTGGAGGAFGVGTQSVGVATIQLPGGHPPPRAIDLIAVDPVNGNAQADRVVPSSPAACEIERVTCTGREPAQ
jgi:hypothetical protein